MSHPNLNTCEPGDIHLVHYTYRVVFAEPDGDPEKWGLIEPGKGIITINPSTPPAFRAGSLTHEMTHDLISPLSDLLADGLEEAICDLVGDGLVTIARRNPDLIRHLVEVASK